MNKPNQSKTPRTDANLICEHIDKLAEHCRLNPTTYQREAKEMVRQLETELAESRALNTKCICMFCHKEYDRNAPETAGDLADHILSCEKSPLVQMVNKAQIICEDMEAELADAKNWLAMLKDQRDKALAERDAAYLERNANQADKERLDFLTSELGDTQQASEQVIKLYQDDATHDYFVTIQPNPMRDYHHFGQSLRSAIDAARKEQL